MPDQPREIRLVILDRDGVINRDSTAFVKSADEWLPLPGSIEAIAALSQAGFLIAVASNQSGVGRGLVSEAALGDMHGKLLELVGLEGGQVDLIVVCPHGPNDSCNCRKPKPGLMHQVGEYFAVDITGVPVIGDSLRDLQAGATAGCRPVLVRTGNGAMTESSLPAELADVEVYDDLAAAAAALLSG